MYNPRRQQRHGGKPPRQQIRLDVGKPQKDGEIYNVTATAFLSEGTKPLTNRSVVFYLDGTVVAEVNTDENGNATHQFSNLGAGKSVQLIVQKKGDTARQSRFLNVPEEKEKKEELPELSLKARTELQAAFTNVLKYCASSTRTIQIFVSWLENLPDDLRVDVISVLAELAQKSKDDAAKLICDMATMNDDNQRTNFAQNSGLIRPLDAAMIVQFNGWLDEFKKAHGDQAADVIYRWTNTLTAQQYRLLVRRVTSWTKKRAVGVLQEIASKKSNRLKTQTAYVRGLIGK